jgi:hypothetical protein
MTMEQLASREGSIFIDSSKTFLEKCILSSRFEAIGTISCSWVPGEN